MIASLIIRLFSDMILNMHYRSRSITDQVRQAALYFPVLVLTGARQVGKSTLLQHLFQSTHDIVVFDPAMDIEQARSEPELFFLNHPGPVVLDEIQYAPELIPVIKRRVDTNKIPGTYILTGSQQWGVLNSISESLAGRALILNLRGYDMLESSNSHTNEQRWLHKFLSHDTCSDIPNRHYQLPFSYTESIYRGQLPYAQDIPLNLIPPFMNSYIAAYIERDVRLLSDVSDIQLFGRFFRLCGALSGQEINHSQLGRDIGITPQTAKRWLEMMRATFQWVEIPAYSGNIIKRISGRQKGYITDTGMLCQSLFLSTPKALPSHPAWGHIIETMVCMEILKICSLLPSPPGIFHWRSHSGAEVDIVLELNGTLYPIEVKATALPSKKDTQSIQAFRKTYPHQRIGTGLVIHLGESWGWITEDAIAVPFTAL